MTNPYIGFRCPQNIYDTLEKYLEETKREKTEYLLNLISADLGIKKAPTLAEKVEALDIRVTAIEAQINH